jgi:RNase P/RNase MRP subunit p29
MNNNNNKYSGTGGKIHFSPLYAKLNQDGTGSSKMLEPEDYDALVNFMKFSFPKTFKIHKDFDETMKRTFILGKTEGKSKSKFLRKKLAKSQGIRKKIFRVSRTAPTNVKYSNFLKLNNLWKYYVDDILGSDTKIVDIQQKLSRVDMHGANIKVSRSNCESLRNLEGIVIKETKHTFIIVTSANETKTLPKCENFFEVVIPDRGIMEISGSAFVSRPAERTNKKIKSFIEYVGPKVYRRQLLGKDCS